MHALLKWLGLSSGPIAQPDASPDPGPYPAPQLLPLLQVLCTPAEYATRRAGADDRQLRKHPATYLDYWAIVPRYTYAECPLCHTRYTEPADTYHLNGWRAESWLYDTLYVYELDAADIRCPHFVGIEVFINLHRHRPEPTDRLNVETGEVPYLTPRFFRQEVPTYAVLHALPVCRVEADTFVPSYTVFLLTHFSADRVELEKRVAVEIERTPHDHWYPAFTPDYPGSDSTHQRPHIRGYDLAGWAARGLLGWLDFRQPELPLQMGPEVALPEQYQRIQGKRRPYSWGGKHLY
ncbi:MAG TPA: hypothetical protein VKY74_19285 [Chloroflexia bacterium]|nr:hypothetical protein [Chloroflexia bacterium]